MIASLEMSIEQRAWRLILFSAILQGCASTSWNLEETRRRCSWGFDALYSIWNCRFWTIKGEIRTTPGRILEVVNAHGRLRLKSGKAQLVFVDRCWPATSDLLWIETREGQLVTEIAITDHGRIQEIPGSLAIGISGTWRDGNPEERIETDGKQNCHTSGYCFKVRSEQRCDSEGKKCSTYTYSQPGSYHDCPGTESVRIESDTYRRFYTLDFVDQRKPAERLARFEGSDKMTRERRRWTTSACRAD
jgi:hypothetical protein